MSSEPPLANTAYRATYERHLAAHLPEGWRAFGAFFGNLARLGTLASLLARHMTGNSQRVLNIGCGPFATEIFVGPLQGHEIVSFDYTAEFVPFFDIFRRDGQLATTMFLRADALSVAFRPDSFDVILIHDVLYETALDLDDLLAQHTPSLRRGGLLYIDVMNRGTRWLWRLLRKERAYRRYAMADVVRTLKARGYEVLESRPAIGAAGPMRLLHVALWRLFRTCNTRAFIAVRVS